MKVVRVTVSRPRTGEKEAQRAARRCKADPRHGPDEENAVRQ